MSVIPFARVLRLLVNVTPPTASEVAFAEAQLARLPRNHRDRHELEYRLDQIRRRIVPPPPDLQLGL